MTVFFGKPALPDEQERVPDIRADPVLWGRSRRCPANTQRMMSGAVPFWTGVEVGEVEFLDGYHRHALLLCVFDETADRFSQAPRRCPEDVSSGMVSLIGLPTGLP